MLEIFDSYLNSSSNSNVGEKYGDYLFQNHISIYAYNIILCHLGLSNGLFLAINIGFYIETCHGIINVSHPFLHRRALNPNLS